MAESILNPEVVRNAKRSSNKAHTDVQVTPVVLVCIYNQNSTVITHDILFNAFCHYGKILRILLFEKMKIWKAFVEYDNLESAMEAKRNLNNFLLFDDGTRINVYYSNIQTIRFQNNNSGGKDYTLDDDGEPHLDYDQPSQSQPFSKTAPQGDLANALAGYREQSMLQDKFSKTAPTDLQKALAGFNADFNPGYNFPPSKNGLNLTLKGGIFDDKDNEILEIINERHDESPTNEQTTKDQSGDEEEKLEFEENEGFAQFFSTFNKKSTEAAKNNLPRSKNHLSNLSLKSQPSGKLAGNQQQPGWDQAEDQQVWQPPSNQQVWNQNSDNHKSATFPQYLNFANQIIAGEGAKSATFPPQKAVSKQRASSPVYVNKQSQTPPKASNGFYNFEEVPSSTPQPQFGKIPSFTSLDGNPANFGPKYPQNGFTGNIGSNQQSNNHNFPADQRQANEPYYKPTKEIAAPVDKSEIEDSNSGGSEYDGLMDLIEKDILKEKNNPNKSLNTKGNNLKGLLQQCANQSAGQSLDKMNLSNLNQLYAELTSMLKTRGGEEEKKSQVLYIKSLESPSITVQMLVNIFGNFGNVTKIVFVRTRASALVEYENAEYSALAKNNLENLSFLGNSLKIYYSNYSITNTMANGPNEEVYIGNPKTFKFNKKKMATINSPSPAIRISNLARIACRDDIIREWIGKFGHVDSVRTAFDDNKCTCSVKMGSTAESLLVIAHLNDSEFHGRKVRISFNRIKM